jgi:hypothetical protein
MSSPLGTILRAMLAMYRAAKKAEAEAAKKEAESCAPSS